MSVLLVLFVGCTNLTGPGWGGGGARYASGQAFYVEGAGGDTGADTGDTDTTLEEGAPYLSGEEAVYAENEAGQIYIQAGVSYDDDPDDVEGGTLYYDLFGDDTFAEDGSRVIVVSDPDYNTDALASQGVINFQVGPVTEGVEHYLTVSVVDYTHNESNEITIPVTGS